MEVGYSQIRKLLNELCYITLEYVKKITPVNEKKSRSKALPLNPLGT